jgi:hypothetical protein
MELVYTNEWKNILRELDALGDLDDDDLEFLPETIIIGESTEF